MEVEIIIKEVREQVGKSLRELSKATGINRQRLSDIENNFIKGVIKDGQTRKVFINEKEYIKIKNMMNKNDNYFNKEKIELLYKLC